MGSIHPTTTETATVAWLRWWNSAQKSGWGCTEAALDDSPMQLTLWDPSLNGSLYITCSTQKVFSRQEYWVGLPFPPPPIQWTWPWANSKRWWRADRTGRLQSMRSQRAGHHVATEQHVEEDTPFHRNQQIYVLSVCGCTGCGGAVREGARGTETATEKEESRGRQWEDPNLHMVFKTCCLPFKNSNQIAPPPTPCPQVSCWCCEITEKCVAKTSLHREGATDFRSQHLSI